MIAAGKGEMLWLAREREIERELGSGAVGVSTTDDTINTTNRLRC